MTRNIIHIVLGLVLWVVFCFYWHLVIQQPITDQTGRALTTVGSLIGIITLFDWAWIFHNVRIARKSRRRARRATPRMPAADFLGRIFAEQEDMLHRARYIEVSVVELADERESTGHKLFRVSDTVPED